MLLLITNIFFKIKNESIAILIIKRSIIFSFILVFTCLAQVNNNTNNLFLLGQSYIKGAKYIEAKEIFIKLYSQQPENYQYFHSLNEVYIQLKLYDSSIVLINKRLQLTPIDINLYGIMGSTYYLSGDEKKAFAVWDESIKKLEPSYINYRVLANHAIERRAFEKAIEYLQAGKKISDDPKMFSYDLGNLYALTMQFENAAKEYCTILANDPKQLGAVESRILSYSGKPNALEATITVVKNWSEKRNINFLFLLTKLYEENENYDNAFEEYLQIEKAQNSNGRYLLTFAQSLLGKNKFTVASKIFNKIIKDYSTSPFLSSAKLGYTKALGEELKGEIIKTSPVWKPIYIKKNILTQKTNEVINAYNELINKYKLSEVGAEAYFRIGEINLEIQNNFDKAVENFTNVINNYTSSMLFADSYKLRAKTFIRKGELNKALSDYDFLIKDGRASNELRNTARFNKATILFYKGDFENASNLLKQISNFKNDNSANNAIELSLLLNTTKSDSLHLIKYAQAEFLINKNKIDSASLILKNLYLNKSTSFVLKSYSTYRYAQTQVALDSLSGALITLSEIIKEEKQNIFADKALFLKGQVYQFGLNNNIDALNMYQEFLEKFPNSIIVDEARKEILKLKNKNE